MLLNKTDQLDMLENNARMRDYEAEDAKREEEEEKKKRNKGFTQVYGKGFQRLQSLISKKPNAAKLWLLLAEKMDGYGALVASQDTLAEYLDLSSRTVRRLTQDLEDENALFRIRVGNGVYCYALDPEEVWKAWNSSKETAIFHTKTLVSKKDRENNTIDKRLALLMKEKTKS